MKNLIYWIMLLSIVLLSCNDHVRDNPLDPQGLCYSVPAPEAPVLSSPADSAINVSLTPTLTWLTVNNAVVYRVQVSTNSAFSNIIEDDSLLTTASKALSTTLATGTTYYWRVCAKNASGTGEWSSVWNFSTALTVPTLTLPLNSATNISITPTLTWSSVNNAATYRIQVSTTSTFGTLVADDSTLTVGLKAITGLANSTTYYWRVKAKNAGSTSSWSSVGSFTTVIAAPGIPTPISPSSGSSGVSVQPSLAWGTVSGAATYRVQVSTNSIFLSIVEDDSLITTASKTLSTTLATGTTYYWRINAKNAGGTGQWSSIRIFSTAPAVPILTSPTNSATNISITPTLTWSTVNNAATYRVQVSTASTFGSSVVDDSTLTVGSMAITGLANSTTYYWRVNAKNTGGTSSWSSVWSFTTTGITFTDIDGNIYHTVKIGTQTWTVENLKTTKYNDGTAIPLVTDGTAWGNLTTGAYCWYNNDVNANKATYGALYNWYAVNTGKLAPTGWHVPTDAEWTTLSTYLGGDNVSGGALKEAGTAHWASPNSGATNSSGFSALPGGYRYYNGYFYYIGSYGYWWSATETAASGAYYRYLFYDYSDLSRNSYFKSCGFSVRLVRDNN